MTFMAALVLLFFFFFFPTSLPHHTSSRYRSGFLFIFFPMPIRQSSLHKRNHKKRDKQTPRLQIRVLNEFVFDPSSYFRQSLVKCMVDVLHSSSLFVPSHQNTIGVYLQCVKSLHSCYTLKHTNRRNLLWSVQMNYRSRVLVVTCF